MITIKQEVKEVLSAVGKAVYGFPRGYVDAPFIAWRESLNRLFAQADGQEHLSELNYTVDVFARDNGEAGEWFARIDAALRALGLRRESMAELFDGDEGLCHISLRYRCLADAQGRIYQ